MLIEPKYKETKNMMDKEFAKKRLEWLIEVTHKAMRKGDSLTDKKDIVTVSMRRGAAVVLITLLKEIDETTESDIAAQLDDISIDLLSDIALSGLVSATMNSLAYLFEKALSEEKKE